MLDHIKGFLERLDSFSRASSKTVNNCVIKTHISIWHIDAGHHLKTHEILSYLGPFLIVNNERGVKCHLLLIYYHKHSLNESPWQQSVANDWISSNFSHKKRTSQTSDLTSDAATAPAATSTHILNQPVNCTRFSLRPLKSKKHSCVRGLLEGILQFATPRWLLAVLLPYSYTSFNMLRRR